MRGVGLSRAGPRSDFENFQRTDGGGPSRALAPALTAGASRSATDDIPRTGTSDRGRRLRTWESGPGAQASGPRDPRVGLGKFSASARTRAGVRRLVRADGEDLGITRELPSVQRANPAGVRGLSPGELTMSFPKLVWMVFGVLLKTLRKSNFPVWSQKAGS